MPIRLPAFLIAAAIAASQASAQVTIRNPGAAKTGAFATFGMIFKPGEIPAGKSVAVAGAAAFQVDAKAAHADGSLRHAVISVALGSMAAGASKALTLSPAAAQSGSALSAADVLQTDFDAVVTVTVGGTAYTASPRDGLAAAKTWLAGPICTEWLVTAPLKSSAGAVHPHLHVRYGIRAYQGLKNIRADVTVENDWAFEPSPSGFTYDVSIAVGGAQVYAKTGLAHTHHARWRKVFWWGGDMGLDWQYDRDYLLATGAFPNYDKTVKIDPAALSALKSDYAPMSNGGFSSYMPETGAHEDIGPLPNFAAIWLLTQDPRALASVVANGGCGGSFQIHYRNKSTGNPVTIDEYPYMTILGNESDTRNPATGKYEAFPAVANGLEVHNPDDAHQPSIAYVPYLITGDYFQLEELQFWANWNMIIANPGYRKEKTGLLYWGQNRAQAWSMRTLGQAAYITPDDHPLKKYFVEKLGNNLAYYNDRYTHSATVNAMGYLDGQFPYEPFGIAPWMDDFFTWSAGYLAQLGFSDALPLAVWKSKFVVGRLTAPGYCWLQASVYTLQVGTADMKPYKSFAEIYAANYPNTSCTGTKMDGYPDEATGYGANMQPAVATAVDVDAAGGQAAWDKYQTRDPKQSWSAMPQFAVVPRKLNGTVLLARARPGYADHGGLAWFTPGARLAFGLRAAADVRLEVYDTNGRRLLDLGMGRMPAGPHRVDPMRDVARREWGPGPYLVRIKATEASRPPEYPSLSPAR